MAGRVSPSSPYQLSHHNHKRFYSPIRKSRKSRRVRVSPHSSGSEGFSKKPRATRVKAEGFFNDSKCFIDSAKMLMKKPAVGFRLEKIVQKTKANMYKKMDW